MILTVVLRVLRTEHFGALKFFAVDRFERFLIETFSQSAGYVKRTAKRLSVKGCESDSVSDASN